MAPLRSGARNALSYGDALDDGADAANDPASVIAPDMYNNGPSARHFATVTPPEALPSNEPRPEDGIGARSIDGGIIIVRGDGTGGVADTDNLDGVGGAAGLSGESIIVGGADTDNLDGVDGAAGSGGESVIVGGAAVVCGGGGTGQDSGDDTTAGGDGGSVSVGDGSNPCRRVGGTH